MSEAVPSENFRLSDRFRHFLKISRIFENLFSNHPTLPHLKLFLCACYRRELWHATNYIKVLGSERNSANCYNKCSIYIPLCHKNSLAFFAANSPGAVNSIACIVTEVYRLYKPFTYLYLDARGKPSTMVSARMACRDGRPNAGT